MINFSGLASGLNKIARPYLTVLITTMYNAALVYGLLRGKIEFKEYIMAMGPTNAMIIGFWFGERAATNRQIKDSGESS